MICLDVLCMCVALSSKWERLNMDGCVAALWVVHGSANDVGFRGTLALAACVLRAPRRRLFVHSTLRALSNSKLGFGG